MDKRCYRCPGKVLQETCGEQLAAAESLASPPTKRERVAEKISTTVRNFLPGPDEGSDPPRTCDWRIRCREQALQRVSDAATHGFDLAQCDLGESNKLGTLLRSLPPAESYDVPPTQKYFLLQDPHEAMWQAMFMEKMIGNPAVPDQEV